MKEAVTSQSTETLYSCTEGSTHWEILKNDLVQKRADSVEDSNVDTVAQQQQQVASIGH